MKNLAVSIRQRILNIARENGKDFQELVQYFAIQSHLPREK